MSIWLFETKYLGQKYSGVLDNRLIGSFFYGETVVQYYQTKKVTDELNEIVWKPETEEYLFIFTKNIRDDQGIPRDRYKVDTTVH